RRPNQKIASIMTHHLVPDDPSAIGFVQTRTEPAAPRAGSRKDATAKCRAPREQLALHPC
ncbi:hypothetical protein, partial [Bacillus sp. SIMBA_008]|uniref:hypothetical protein n=1 Tax=Bacillus sp. SIMBA_008 TaxID=3085757 RepID=UPI00397C1154